jgi:hypothetical protein
MRELIDCSFRNAAPIQPEMLPCRTVSGADWFLQNRQILNVRRSGHTRRHFGGLSGVGGEYGTFIDDCACVF